MTKRWSVAIVLVSAGWAATVALPACSKKDESARPAGVPALEPGATPPPAAPAMAPTAPVAPPAAPVAPPAAPADPKATITGQISLAPAIAKLKPRGTLYLTARRLSDNPSARGTLIAVKRFDGPSFPLPFSLSAADMPFQNGPFDGELTLSARIDQDGDPMTRQKGDVFGTLPKVQVGSQGVKLPIDGVQKESESLGQPGPMGGGLPPGHPQ